MQAQPHKYSHISFTWVDHGLNEVSIHFTIHKFSSHFWEREHLNILCGGSGQGDKPQAV